VRALSSASSPMLPAAWEQALELASEALAPRGAHWHRYACTPWEDAVRPGVHRVAALIAQQRAHRGLFPRIRVPRGTERLSVCVLFDRLDVVLLSTINITMFVWTSAWVAKGLPRAGTRQTRACLRRQLCMTNVARSSGNSRSVPFAPVPEAVRESGLAGSEAEFDPLMITSYLPISWMRESEVKHGRIAMLAFVGTLAQQAYQFPWYKGAPTTLVGAHDHFVTTALAQILLFTSAFEIVAGVPAAIQTVRGSGRLPGYYGFDPLGLWGKDEASRKRMELAEVKNGRLAMIAMLALWHQEVLSGGMGVIEQLVKQKFTP